MGSKLYVIASWRLFLVNVSDLQDSGCVQQVWDELWQSLATEGQSEQVATSALSWEQLSANSGLLHCQGQSRQSTHITRDNRHWKGLVLSIKENCYNTSCQLTQAGCYLPATGIMVSELFKTLPVVSVYQTDDWLWGRANTHSVHTTKTYLTCSASAELLLKEKFP